MRIYIYMNKIFLIFLFLISFVFIPSVGYSGDLIWGGCGITKKAFMAELAKAYKKKTGVKIYLKGGGATYGIRAVAIGRIDIGGSCRHKLSERDILEKNTKLIPVAWDALVVIVNKKNKVKNITIQQLKDVLLGKITKWSQLGGPDKPIKLVIRKSKVSGVSFMLREMVFGDVNIDFIRNAVVKKSSGPVEKYVEKNIDSIAISGISSARKRKGLKFLDLNGAAPTKKNIAARKYPLVRPLYLTVGPHPSNQVKDFIKFALSPEGQAVISKQGTVNLKEGKPSGSFSK